MPKINQEEYEAVLKGIVSDGEFWIGDIRYVPVERSKESEVEYSRKVNNFIKAVMKKKVEEGRVRLTVGFDGGTESYYATDIGDALDFLTDYDARFTVSKEPIIPKFVAEWYESEGKQSSWWNWFYKWGRDESRTELETKTIRWMQDFNEEAFVNMFLHGYTVEKERKYYVLNNEKYFLLGKDKGHGFIFSTGGNSKLGSMERTSATFELTEQEIKDYDPRYMAFAVKVEELEE